MPKLEDIRSEEIDDLKAVLFQDSATLTVDHTFEVLQPVNLQDVVSQETQNKTPAKWSSIGVRLYNFAIGEQTPPVDEPDDVQYVGMCLCPAPFSSRTDEFEDTPKADGLTIRWNCGHYGGLYAREPVYFAVDAGAFEVDTTPVWEGLVKALGSDIDSVGQVAKLFTNSLPGLGAFQTPGAAINAVSRVVKKGLGSLDDDDFVGDVTIIDTLAPSHWYRKIDQETWLARKWVVHTQRNNTAWYLSQWFIKLSIWPLDQEFAASQPPPKSKTLGVLQDFAGGFHPDAAMDIAALRVLRGEKIGVVAEAMHLKPTNINAALASFAESTDEEVIARLTNIIASKLA